MATAGDAPMTGWLAAACALGAAAFFSLSSALKHRSATVPVADRHARGIGAPLQMARSMLGHRWWQAGIATDVGGFVLQAIGLHLGGLVLVQPILVTAVAGSLLATAWLDHRRPSRHQLGWALVLIAALAAFLTLLQLHGSLHSTPPDRAPAYLLGVLGAAVVLLAVGVGRVRRVGRVAASTLGAATGLLYAGSAALITVVAAQVTGAGVVAALSKDEVYVLVALGVISQLLSQAAFTASSLSASVPVATVVDLTASVVLGIAVFDQPVPRDVPTVALAVAALLVAFRATFALSAAGTASTGDPANVVDP